MKLLPHHRREGKLNYLFVPIPQDLPGQWLEENRSASEIEQVYWMLSRLKIPGFKVTERYASAQLRITRHQARTLKKQCLTLLDMKSTKLQPKTCEDQPSTETQTQSCDPVILEFPENSTKSQPETCKDQPHNKESEKNSELINYYNKNLSKNFPQRLQKKSIAEVWNHWHQKHNGGTRSVGRRDASVINQALTKHGLTVEECKLIVDFILTAPDAQWHRDHDMTRPQNILNGNVFEKNIDKATEWKNKSRPSMPQKLSALPKRRIHPTVNQFGPNGHLLPEHGGKVRPGGKY